MFEMLSSPLVMMAAAAVAGGLFVGHWPKIKSMFESEVYKVERALAPHTQALQIHTSAVRDNTAALAANTEATKASTAPAAH